MIDETIKKVKKVKKLKRNGKYFLEKYGFPDPFHSVTKILEVYANPALVYAAAKKAAANALENPDLNDKDAANLVFSDWRKKADIGKEVHEKINYEALGGKIGKWDAKI